MKKKIAIVLIGISTLVCLAWLQPRVLDEKLIFKPTPLSEDTFTGPELRKLLREVWTNNTFSARAENEKTVRRLIDSRDLVCYTKALVCINRSIEKGETISEEFRDGNFLRSKLIDCLKTDVNRIYYAIEKEPYADYCYEWGHGSCQESLWSKIVLRLLKEFTFQKNKTLNQYWAAILELERSRGSNLSINCDGTTFSKGNFYGEMFLAIATPSVEQTVKLIETISVQSNSPTNYPPVCPRSHARPVD